MWSDDDQKYDGTRIIFLDTEKSNWTWDPVAGQYFWHRFYSHQPDLNFDNPQVMKAVIDVMRALPPLVLLIFVYSGLPFAGIEMAPFVAVAVAFLLNNSAYYAEVYRAGIQSIPKGQWEAARATGLSVPQTLTQVILPQAVRNVLPDLLSNTVEVVKLTSLASVVSLAELLYQANMARSVTYNSSPLVLAAAIYLVILWPCVRLVSRFQRKLSI